MSDLLRGENPEIPLEIWSRRGPAVGYAQPGEALDGIIHITPRSNAGRCGTETKRWKEEEPTGNRERRYIKSRGLILSRKASKWNLSDQIFTVNYVVLT